MHINSFVFYAANSRLDESLFLRTRSVWPSHPRFAQVASITRNPSAPVRFRCSSRAHWRGAMGPGPLRLSFCAPPCRLNEMSRGSETVRGSTPCITTGTGQRFIEKTAIKPHSPRGAGERGVASDTSNLRYWAPPPFTALVDANVSGCSFHSQPLRYACFAFAAQCWGNALRAASAHCLGVAVSPLPPAGERLNVTETPPATYGNQT